VLREFALGMIDPETNVINNPQVKEEDKS